MAGAVLDITFCPLTPLLPVYAFARRYADQRGTRGGVYGSTQSGKSRLISFAVIGD